MLCVFFSLKARVARSLERRAPLHGRYVPALRYGKDTEQSLPWECFITIQLHERLSRGGIEELGVNDRQQKRPIQVSSVGRHVARRMICNVIVCARSLTLNLGLLCFERFSGFQVMVPDGLFSYGDGCAMSMPQGRLGTLHDMVTHYARSSESTPQLVAMHYAVEVRYVVHTRGTLANRSSLHEVVVVHAASRIS